MGRRSGRVEADEEGERCSGSSPGPLQVGKFGRRPDEDPGVIRWRMVGRPRQVWKLSRRIRLNGPLGSTPGVRHSATVSAG